MKTIKNAAEAMDVAATCVLLFSQISRPDVSMRTSERRKKAREVGSDGGMILPPYITGEPMKYAIRRTEEEKNTRSANTTAAAARLWCSIDEETVSNDDRVETAKKIAVTGDIWPREAPPKLPWIEKPRSSICDCAPMEESKNNNNEERRTIELMKILDKYAWRFPGKRTRKNIATPSITKHNAVLGAMGIRSGPKLASRGIFKNHPSREVSPRPAVRSTNS
jgi:hypothetical protein